MANTTSTAAPHSERRLAFFERYLSLWVGLFPGTVQRIHWPFEDPAVVEGPENVRLAAFRKVRDQIHRRIMVFLNGDESV